MIQQLLQKIYTAIAKYNSITQYQIQFESIEAQKVIDSNCNAICFVSNFNNTLPVLVNGIPLYPGTAINISGNNNEKDITKYRIDMPAGNQEIIIIRKINQ